MIVRSFVVGPLQENCSLVIDESTNEAVLVDPGDEADRLLAAVGEAGVTLTAIWLTHAHFDHLGAVAAIKRATGVPIYVHPLDNTLYNLAEKSGASYGLRVENPPPADVALKDGDTLAVGTLTFAVMHAPGHSPGHVVIYGNGIVLAGDCLFAGSVGRTDLPFSNPRHLSESLVRIAALD